MWSTCFALPCSIAVLVTLVQSRLPARQCSAVQCSASINAILYSRELFCSPLPFFVVCCYYWCTRILLLIGIISRGDISVSKSVFGTFETVVLCVAHPVQSRERVHYVWDRQTERRDNYSNAHPNKNNRCLQDLNSTLRIGGRPQREQADDKSDMAPDDRPTRTNIVIHFTFLPLCVLCYRSLYLYHCYHARIHQSIHIFSTFPGRNRFEKSKAKQSETSYDTDQIIAVRGCVDQATAASYFVCFLSP